MKKFLSLILVITLVLGLCACSGSADKGGKEEAGLQVGYNRQSILPTEPVQMAGYGNQASRILRLLRYYLCYLYRFPGKRQHRVALRPGLAPYGG